MSVRERMKQYLKTITVSEGYFEKECGLSNGYVSKIGDSIRTSILKKIEDKHQQLNISWLLTGEGEMLKSEKKVQLVPNAVFIDNPNIKMIPIVSQYAYAGYLSGFADAEYVESLPTMPFLMDHEAKGTYLGFEVKGDSMDDETSKSICEGDLLACRNISKDLWMSKLHINKWLFVIVHKTDGVLVKRIVDHDVDNGNITIHSYNSLYEDRVLNLKEVAQLFNVVQILKTPRL